MDDLELDQAKARRKAEIDVIDADAALWTELRKQGVPPPFLHAAVALFRKHHRIEGSAVDGFTCPGRFGENSLAGAVEVYLREGKGAVFPTARGA